MEDKEFGKWTVLEYAFSKNRKVFWNCQCECGTIQIVDGYILRKGKSTKCKKCSYEERGVNAREDMIGKTFNGWTVLEFVFVRNRNAWYKCSCKCGYQKNCNGALLRNNLSRCCRRCSQLEAVGDITGNTYSHIRNTAKNRNINFDLSKEFLWELFLKQKGSCQLTGLPLFFTNNIHKRTASLDRIDSAIDYNENNVQWVHKDINMMKYKFNQEYFIEMCCLVADSYRKGLNEQRK